uniref:Aquaporin n=1 Tax=Sparus aurata TaxID=8175 RepID=A0A671UFC4_SPAAU
ASMTADVAVSLVLLAGIVALSDATRRLLTRCPRGHRALRLCCCTHELRLLSEVGGIEPRLALTLTYLAAVIHGLTFSGAIGNPSGALEHAYYASVCMSGLHARHKLLGYRCISPIHAPLPKAAAVELACAFAVQTAITHTRSVEEKYRVHAVTAAIATVVYAGMTALFSIALVPSTKSFQDLSAGFWIFAEINL